MRLVDLAGSERVAATAGVSLCDLNWSCVAVFWARSGSRRGYRWGGGSNDFCAFHDPKAFLHSDGMPLERLVLYAYILKICISKVTGTDGARLQEACLINKSLATLCNVIEALGEHCGA